MAARGGILVTGATGTVGQQVVVDLQRHGAPVVAAVRNVERARAALGADVRCTPFDFVRPDTFAGAFTDVSRLFLVRPPEIADVKRLIVPAIEAARLAGVDHVVFLSVLGAERIRVVPHYRIEQALRGSGMAWTFLRPSFFLQNLSTVHRLDVRDRGEIFVPAGHGKTSFIDARDVGTVGALALVDGSHRGRAYPLTGAAALDYFELAAIFSTVLGRPIRYARPSLFAFARHMRAEGHPWPFIMTTIAIYTTARLGLAAAVTDDLRRLLDREPTSPARFVEDYRDRWAPAPTARSAS